MTAPITTVEAPVDPEIVFRELKWVIAEEITRHPRSQQKSIGASEIGVACERRLGYKLLDVAVANIQPPGWRPTVGTACHYWLEVCFENRNVLDGYTQAEGRWATEEKLVVGAISGVPIWGTSDLFDRATGTSIDWKVVGTTTLRKAKAGNIDEPYKIQGHVYGRGREIRGETVHTVMIVFLPSSGELAQAVYWAEPYSREKAEAAFARAQRVHTLATMVTDTRALLAMLPVADAHCSHCPWFKVGSTDLAVGCPGVEELNTRHPINDATVDLLAPHLREQPALPPRR